MNDIQELTNSDITNEEWKFLLLLILMEDIKQRDSQWKSFENELIYKNRFSVKHAIIDEIHKCKNEAIKTIKSGTVLYRARIFEKSNIDKLVKYYLNENGYKKEEIEAVLKELTDYNDIKLLSLMPELYSDCDSKQFSSLVQAQKKWKRNVKFKGWNAKDSSAPPADRIGNGRANPDHIRYMYLCEDNITPIYEVRPIIGQTVSVAKFKLDRDVKIYDLTINLYELLNDNVTKFPKLFNTIGEMFSRPYNGDMFRYLPTQYIAEEIKNMGFDGLRFKSSLHQDGVNIVLFNPEICNAISSDLVEVKEITLKLDEPIIYKIGTPHINDEIKNLNFK